MHIADEEMKLYKILTLTLLSHWHNRPVPPKFTVSYHILGLTKDIRHASYMTILL